jgi:hypothetical protein
LKFHEKYDGNRYLAVKDTPGMEKQHKGCMLSNRLLPREGELTIKHDKGFLVNGK